MNISNGLMPVPSLAGQDERPLVENLHICIYPIWILPVAGLGHSVHPVTAPGSWVSPISGTWDPQPCSISSDAVTHRHVQTSALRTHMHTSLSLSLIPPLNIPKLILYILQIPFLVSFNISTPLSSDLVACEPIWRDAAIDLSSGCLTWTLRLTALLEQPWEELE